MKINGGLIALLVIIILVTIAVIGFVWWKFFYKKNEKNSGFLTNYRFKKTTHLISMNKKHKGKSGVVLESGKLTLFRNIKTEKELKLNNWSARVSEQLSGIIIAAPGSGKTQSTILPTIMFNAVATDKPRMIITDPKGECYKNTKKFLEKQGIKTYVLNFNDSNSIEYIYSHCFNPLSNIIELHKKYCEAQENISKEIYLGKLKAKISRTFDLFDVFNNKNVDPFWWKKGKRLVQFTLSLMLFGLENKEFNPLKIYSYEQINLGNLYDNVNRIDASDLNDYLKILNETEKVSNLKNWFMNYASTSKKIDEKQLGSFKENATDLLELFSNPENNYLSAKSDFNISDFLKKQSALFLILPNSETKRKIANLFLEILYDDLNDVVINEYKDKLPFPCWFLIDEAGTMQSISWLGEVLNQGRGRNMHLLMVFQNTEQIDAKYKGQGLTKSTQYKILYSSQDLKYAEEISRSIGYKDGAKNQQDLIIQPNQILKIEPEKALVVSVKENKPYFTTNLPFWKVKDIQYEANIYSQPIFVLNNIYSKLFNFNEILKDIFTKNGINLPNEEIIKKPISIKQENNNSSTKQTENKENILDKQQKVESKKAMMLELNNFLDNNNFNDEIKEEIKKNFLLFIKNLKDFEKVADKTQNQTIYQKIMENIDEIWNQMDRDVEWTFLKKLQNELKQKYKTNKEIYEIMESDSTDDFEFDLSSFVKTNQEEPQKQKNETQNIKVSSFERKPLGPNPLLKEAMMKFWRQKWGDKLADEIFKDEKKKELNKNE